MSKGVREGFAAVRALGLSVTPFPLRVLFTWLPQGFVIRYWRGFFASEIADVVFDNTRARPRGKCAKWRTTVAYY